MIEPFDYHPRTRVVFGAGALNGLGQLACDLNFHRTLLVADPGLVACGYVEQAIKLLKKSCIEIFTFCEFDANPDTVMVEAGRDFAAPLSIDSIIGLGGGSSMDCAKAINFLLT